MFQNFEAGGGSAESAVRVAALRGALAQAGVTGFLVPRADAHQGETVAPHDERLAWLTGFTGSAGIAVVLADRAALFVDGRYTVQARRQADTKLFEIVPLHTIPPHDWLEGVLIAAERIGYDPWLHGRAEIEKIRAVAEKKGAELVSLAANPLDAVWTDQPPPPAGSVRIHPASLAGEEAGAKRARIGAAIEKAGARAAVLSLPESLCWLLNIRGSDLARSPVAQGFGIVRADGRVELAMEPDKIGGDVRAHLGNEVGVHPVDALPDLVAGLEGPVLLDETTAPLWFAERLDAAGTAVVWGRDPRRAAEGAQERGRARRHARRSPARRRGDGAIPALVRHGPGRGERLTEIDVATKLEGMRAATGRLLDISFDTIAGAGPNAALPHYRVNRDSNRVLEPGELMLVDSGAQYDDGTTT